MAALWRAKFHQNVRWSAREQHPAAVASSRLEVAAERALRRRPVRDGDDGPHLHGAARVRAVGHPGEVGPVLAEHQRRRVDPAHQGGDGARRLDLRHTSTEVVAGAVRAEGADHPPGRGVPDDLGVRPRQVDAAVAVDEDAVLDPRARDVGTAVEALRLQVGRSGGARGRGEREPCRAATRRVRWPS